jgi:hypothetical protein
MSSDAAIVSPKITLVLIRSFEAFNRGPGGAKDPFTARGLIGSTGRILYSPLESPSQSGICEN